MPRRKRVHRKGRKKRQRRPSGKILCPRVLVEEKKKPSGREEPRSWGRRGGEGPSSIRRKKQSYADVEKGKTAPTQGKKEKKLLSADKKF